MIDPFNLESEESLHLEFEKQMQNLVNEAQASVGKPPNAAVSLPQVGRLIEENARSIARLEAVLRQQEKGLGAVAELREGVNQKVALNQQLFDVLHAELKRYRDNALLEVSQRPLIMDVIGIYDELQRLFAQLEEAEKTSSPLAAVKTSTDHLLHHVLEVLERVGVTKRDSLTGKYDMNCQRAVSRVETAEREEDGTVAKSVRPGFQWRGCVVRPEEVVVKKWSEMAVSGTPPDEPQTLKLEKEKL